LQGRFGSPKPAATKIRLPCEIFALLNTKSIQPGPKDSLPREIHTSDSEAYFTGACPVEFCLGDTKGDSTGAKRISLGPAP